MMDRVRRVYVSDTDFRGRVEVAIVKKDGEQRWVGHYLPGLRQWKYEPFDRGATLSGPGPTIVFDVEDAHELYQELHKFFSNLGMKTKEQSFVEGELEATKKHLTDVRHLLKLPARKIIDGP